MSRPRTPTNVLDLRGSYKKDPQRRAARANEPPSTGELGEPPGRLSELEREAWFEFVDECPPGVLLREHRGLVEQAARLMAEMWTLGAAFPTSRGTLLFQIRRSCGMTPVERSKVGVPKKPELNNNPFSKLIKRGREIRSK
ncbi:phage terminase, small subunit, putative [Burkholderia gladioli BSR3]|uniref:Phage terminase, small subunit, putative n=1 Tax=Burkholderia gladioli (strain BSR3) TaxID=999541 RepID=F2LAT6_BURGS|nr:phage terminase, small subunit, putative [Burkholderia gladioli BSR3]